MTIKIVALLALNLPPLQNTAQAQSSVPVKTSTSTDKGGAYNWLYQGGWVCGGGASVSSASHVPSAQCGGLISFPLLDFEAGLFGPQSNQNSLSAYISTNAWAPLMKPASQKAASGLPLVVGGYTHIFGTGNALDYGLGYAIPIDRSHSIQLEARDYWTFSQPAQHNVIFRIVWLTGIPD